MTPWSRAAFTRRLYERHPFRDLLLRKHIGYGYIDDSHAERLNAFYRDFMNPYLNYHRPCAQPQVSIDYKGRKRITYKRHQTPIENLLALHQAAKYFRPGLTINALQRVAKPPNSCNRPRQNSSHKWG